MLAIWRRSRRPSVRTPDARSPRRPGATIPVRRSPRPEARPHRHPADRKAPLALGATLLACLGLLALPCAASPGQEQFERGNRAAEAGDWRTALEAYEAAIRAGLAGPAVHYNIGVAAFRSGDLSRAQAAFLEVARTPAMAPLAHYNLGLVEQASGDAAAARHWFSRVLAESDDERLADLAAAQLATEPRRPEARNWSVFTALGAGHDDNVALLSDADLIGASGVADEFVEALFVVGGPLDTPWRLAATVARVDYLELDQFDQLAFNGTARYRHERGRWIQEAAVDLTEVTLDGDDFESRAALTLQTESRARAGRSVRVRYRLVGVSGHGDFEGLSGTLHDLDIRMVWQRDGLDLAGTVNIDASNHRDPALSSVALQIGLDARWRFATAWVAELGGGVRRSRFDDDMNGSREEDRFVATAAIGRDAGRHCRVVARYAYADNDSTRAEYDYAANRVSAAVECGF